MEFDIKTEYGELLNKIEMEGYDAFYGDKKASDNPYAGTYNRPEVIIEGVNDEDMTDDDWDKHHRMKAWAIGYASADIKAKQYAGAMKVKNEIDLLEDKVKRYNNEINLLKKTILGMTADFNLLVKYPPIFKKSVLKEVKKIVDTYIQDA